MNRVTLLRALAEDESEGGSLPGDGKALLQRRLEDEGELQFQAVAWLCEDEEANEHEDDDDEEEEEDDDESDGGRRQEEEAAVECVIRVFGVTAGGQSVALAVRSFRPHFYFRVERHWTPVQLRSLKDFVMSHKRLGVLAAREVSKVDFYGFRNGETDRFVRVDCRSVRAMRIMAYKLRQPEHARGGSSSVREVKLYESNIEPLLRFMHMRDVQPAGWIGVRRKDLRAAADSRCDGSFSAPWTAVNALRGRHDGAPVVVASFDIECSSSHGDFPTPRKDYKRLAQELAVIASAAPSKALSKYEAERLLERCLRQALTGEDQGVAGVSRVHLKNPAAPLPPRLPLLVDDLHAGLFAASRGRPALDPLATLNAALPPVEGDAIIQIGVTFGVCGAAIRGVAEHRHVFVLGGCADVPGATVHSFATERQLLVAWARFMAAADPDVLVGYNILGFDMEYIFIRATELRCETDVLAALSRLRRQPAAYKETKLSSSALGDNILKVIDMPGRVSLDLMKVVQRDHKLDSYKLDAVAEHFTGQRKNDVSPADIFRLQRGSDADRATIAAYCVQDCELVLRLAWKLEVMANNMGMANVCTVPLTYIFMRGQGVKIFSLVAKQCKCEGYIIPTAARVVAGEEDEEGYEGAIVLEPRPGIYLEPVSVLDYASLYPSSMISENLSHDSIVLDQRYADVPGVRYLDVAYDLYEAASGGAKVKVGERVCRFAQDVNGRKGVIPRILQDLVGQRKATRKMIEHRRATLPDGTVITGPVSGQGDERVITDAATGTVWSLAALAGGEPEDAYNEFQRAVLDGLQQAYKVTANSLYGALGARTNPLYLKDIAACTTATGRALILKAKAFVQQEFGARVIYGDSVAGHTPVPVRVAGVNVVYQTIGALAAAYGGGRWRRCHGEGPGRETKEACELAGVEAWTEEGWTPLRRVIRHRLAPGKRVLRVRTAGGVVDATDEHSLLRPDGRCVSPAAALAEGGPLMHAPHPAWTSRACAALDLSTEEAHIMGMYFGCRCAISVAAVEARRGRATPLFVWHRSREVVAGVLEACALVYPQVQWFIEDTSSPFNPRLFALVPTGPRARQFCDAHVAAASSGGSYVVPHSVLSTPYDEVKLAFLEGLYTVNPGCLAWSQLTAATLHVLLESVCTRGAVAVLQHGAGHHFRLAWTPSADHAVAGVEPAPLGATDDGYVYDLTTANAHFAAGVGTLVVHNTDSIFCIFPNKDDATGEKLQGRAALAKSIATGGAASRAFKPHLKPPHDLEYEKTFYPFIILSKKRYVGNLYEHDVNTYKQKSMGIVLKRRDNANIVKHMYGGIIDIILNRQDVPASVEFLRRSLTDLIHGRCPIEDLVITKSLRAESSYKDPTKIAHFVLSKRMGERDPGNRPQASDRIPYVYIVQPKAVLQGDKIEHPAYVAQKQLKVDYRFYIEHQIMKPVGQLYAIVLEQLAGYDKPPGYWAQETRRLTQALDGDAAKAKEKIASMREKEAERLLFGWVFADPTVKRAELESKGLRCIRDFMVPR